MFIWSTAFSTAVPKLGPKVKKDYFFTVYVSKTTIPLEELGSNTIHYKEPNEDVPTGDKWLKAPIVSVIVVPKSLHKSALSPIS